jgi:hypothetical protein
MNWYITNFTELSNNNYNFHSNLVDKSKDYAVFHIDGYILPRQSIYDEYKDLDQYEVLKTLFYKHSYNFINYIKGIFNIVVFIGNNFYVFNDRHGIKKVFIYQKNNLFIISNSLEFIANKVELSLSKENAALFCLLEHFVNGITLFNEVSYSNPATTISFQNKELSFSNYWKPSSLFKMPINKKRYAYLAEEWKNIIKNHVKYLQPKKNSITLTGGNDSRMVLAGLLKNGITTNSFSFGNPSSADGFIAKETASYININYNNHYIKKPSKKWFKYYSNKIITQGNSLINIHRAHRMDAIEKEKSINPDTEMLFGGFLGGEYIKGLSYDDYIISKFIRLYESRKNYGIDRLIRDLLYEKKIFHEEIDISIVKNKMKFIFEIGENFQKKQREFLYAFYLYGHAHHSQDISIITEKIKYSVNPFMDIDFLELLAESPYWFVNKKTTFLYHKLFSSKLHIKTTDYLAPQLSRIPYAKKGEYTANEFINKPLRYIFKRVRSINNNKSYAPNFPLEDWLKNYSIQELNYFYEDLRSIFNVKKLRNELEELDSHSEKDWHIITNPINLSLILKHYV